MISSRILRMILTIVLNTGSAALLKSAEWFSEVNATFPLGPIVDPARLSDDIGPLASM
jgi:hypothetical protein